MNRQEAFNACTRALIDSGEFSLSSRPSAGKLIGMWCDGGAELCALYPDRIEYLDTYLSRRAAVIVFSAMHGEVPLREMTEETYCGGWSGPEVHS